MALALLGKAGRRAGRQVGGWMSGLAGRHLQNPKYVLIRIDLPDKID